MEEGAEFIKEGGGGSGRRRGEGVHVEDYLGGGGGDEGCLRSVMRSSVSHGDIVVLILSF